MLFDIKYNMKNFKEKYRTIISFACSFLLSCGLCFVFAFSSSETINEITPISSHEFSLYCISVAKSQLESEAKTLAEDSVKTNSGGYVWKKGNYFHVIASAYKNKNDAVLVSTALSNNKIQNEIIEFKYNELRITTSNLSNEQSLFFNKAIKFFTNCYQELFDVSVCIDTQLYDDKKALLEINATITKAKEINDSYLLVPDDGKNLFINQLELALKQTYQTLENLSQNKKIYEKQTFLSLVRFSYIKTCAIFYDFLNSVN